MPIFLGPFDHVSIPGARQSQIAFFETESLEHMHVDSIRVGTDTLVPFALGHSGKLLRREPHDGLFRDLLKPCDNLPGFEPAAIQSNQIALTRGCAFALLFEWRKSLFPHYRGQEDATLCLSTY